MIYHKHRGLVARIAGNLAGQIRKEYNGQADEVVAKQAVDLAVAIVAEVDKRIETSE